jgi:hypothetical protein
MQTVQAEEEIHCRQFGKDMLHNVQVLFTVPLAERYATDEHAVHVKELFRDAQLKQNWLTSEHERQDMLDSPPTLIDPEGQIRRQLLLTKINPCKQIEHEVAFRQVAQ